MSSDRPQVTLPKAQATLLDTNRSRVSNVHTSNVPNVVCTVKTSNDDRPVKDSSTIHHIDNLPGNIKESDNSLNIQEEEWKVKGSRRERRRPGKTWNKEDHKTETNGLKVTQGKENNSPGSLNPASFSEVLNRPRPDQTTKKAAKPKLSVVGTKTPEDEPGLVGIKKAWLHLGKLKNGTTTKDVEGFVQKTFPGVSFDIEKLASKGMTCSFKLGLDFEHREIVLESAKWPKYVTLRRFFLAKRPASNSIR